MNRSYFSITNVDKLKYGVFLSLAWAALASFIYFDTLTKYPASYDEFLHLRLGDYFEWDDDYARRDEALEYAKAYGNGAQAELLLDCGFRFLKPNFKAQGYLGLVVWPVLIGYLVVNIATWGTMYLVLGILGYLLFLSLSGIAGLFKIFILLCVLICFCWLLIKRAVYELSYMFYRAKEDVQDGGEKC